MIDEHDKAVQDFDTVIKKNPKNAHAYFRRAFSLKALKVSSISDEMTIFLRMISDTLRLSRTSKRLANWIQ